MLHKPAVTEVPTTTTAAEICPLVLNESSDLQPLTAPPRGEGEQEDPDGITVGCLEGIQIFFF